MAKREFTPAILFLSGLRMVAEYLQNIYLAASRLGKYSATIHRDWEE